MSPFESFFGRFIGKADKGKDKTTPDEANVSASGQPEKVAPAPVVTEKSPGRRVEAVAFEEHASLETAAEIMGSNFHGPDAVEKTFGIKIPESEIPAILFSTEDLERAKKLGEILILRTDTAPDGQPLTMGKMDELLENKYKKGEKRALLITGKSDKGDFFTEEAPELRWALVKGVVPDSTNKNYLEQTEILAGYITGTVFKDKDIPEEYTEAIKELEEQKEDIAALMETDQKKAAELLVNLKINQLARHTPAEIIYDILVHDQSTGNNLVASRAPNGFPLNCRVRTNRLSSDGKNIMDIGEYTHLFGARMNENHPGYSTVDVGLSCSRTI